MNSRQLGTRDSHARMASIRFIRKQRGKCVRSPTTLHGQVLDASDTLGAPLGQLVSRLVSPSRGPVRYRARYHSIVAMLRYPSRLWIPTSAACASQPHGEKIRSTVAKVIMSFDDGGRMTRYRKIKKWGCVHICFSRLRMAANTSHK